MATGPNPFSFACQEDYQRALYEWERNRQMQYALQQGMLNQLGAGIGGNANQAQTMQQPQKKAEPKKPAYQNPKLLLTRKV